MSLWEQRLENNEKMYLLDAQSDYGVTSTVQDLMVFAIMEKGRITMFKRMKSCENENREYLCLSFIRLGFEDGKYVGWYKP